MERTEPTSNRGSSASSSEADQESFAALLRRYRLVTGLSQEALAERAGVHVETVGALERGLSLTPQRETVRLLADALALGAHERQALEAALVRRRGARTAASGSHPRNGMTAPSVVLCSSQEDDAFVSRLRVDLIARGITARDQHLGLRRGLADLDEALRAAVRVCRAVLVAVSPGARQSRSVMATLAVAEMYGRPVVPVWCAGEEWLDCVPTALRGIPPIDARGPRYAEALVALVGGLTVDLASVVDHGVGSSGAEPPRNPYKGLHAFLEADAGDFFGRTSLVTALVDAVAATLAPDQAAAARLLVVVGASGSGKSSLVRAGLLPRLKAGAVPGSQEWVYLEPVVPGVHPTEALTVALAKRMDRSLPTLRDDLTADSARGLHLVAQLLAPGPETRVVLVIDQFEELFTLTATEEERRQCIDLLLAAISEPRGPLLAVLTLRADFYDRPLAYPHLGALLETHGKVVPPMTVAELREAVERPAALPDVRLTIEAGLVGDLLFEVAGQAGALPLLEFTLDQLFARREGHTLTAAAYRKVGGLRGALTRHAEATFAALPSDEHRGLARALFLRLLDPGATQQDTTRRRAALRELSLPDEQRTAMLRVVADAFVGARLLTTGEYAGGTTLEVSHEALIGEWARLADWLHEAREDIRLQQTISTDSATWLQRGRPADHLYRGTMLAEAQAWAARNLPSTLEHVFVETAAVAASVQETAETERRARELALARRAATRLRMLAGTLVLFLLVATALSLLAVRSSSGAQANARRAMVVQATAVAERDAVLVALSHQLASQAGTLATSQPQLALLLGVQANRLSPSAENRLALMRLVNQYPRLLAFLAAGAGPVPSLAFSPRGTLLATGGEDAIQIWDVAQHRPVGTPLASSGGLVTSVAFSPDGTLLAAGDGSPGITVWEVSRRHLWGPLLSGPESLITSVAFSPDGRLLAGGSIDGTTWLWQTDGKHALGMSLGRQGGAVQGVAFSRDGALLAAGGDDGTIRLWAVGPRRAGGVLHLSPAASVLAVAFSPDASVLAAAGGDGMIHLWDLARRQEVAPPLRGYRGAVYSVAFSPDGRLVASGGEDATVRLWDVAHRQALGAPLTGHSDAVWAVAFSPDGRLLASASKDGTIRLWDATGSQAPSVHLTANSGAVYSVAFSPDSRILASGHDDGTIRLWDVATHQPLGLLLQAHGYAVSAVDFSPDGRILASGGNDGTIELWDVAHRRALGPPLLGHRRGVYAVVFSPDGKTLASVGVDGTIRLWDVAQHRALGPPLAAEAATVWTTAYNPDGTILATGDDEGRIQLWSVVQRRELGQPLTGHTGAVLTVAFSPDGKTVASGGHDGTVRLWDVARRRALGALPLETPAGEVSTVVFSPNGELLASSSADGTVGLWHFGLRALALRACAIASRNLTVPEWRQYISDLPYQKTCSGPL